MRIFPVCLILSEVLYRVSCMIKNQNISASRAATVWFFRTETKEHSITQPPDMLTFCWSIYGIYVIPSTKTLRKFFKGNIQLCSTIAKFDFDGHQNHCSCNPKSREIFFWSWEVSFDMIDIEPSLDRSTEISILGLALLESPEALQGFGVLTVAKKTGRRLCQRGLCLLF